MILAIGLAVTAIFGESSLQSWVPPDGPVITVPCNRKKKFTKNTNTYQP